MSTRFRRRHFLLATGALLTTGCAGFQRARERSLEDRLQEIRARVGGRIGIHARDMESGRELSFDADSRYATASTFKLLLAAHVLAQVDREHFTLDQQVAITQSDMVEHAPVTTKLLSKGVITIEEACAAIVEVSDNTAANLLLELIGGPMALTGWLRTIGDDVTRLDRMELELNSNLPDDPRDTTTARAMVSTTARVLLGDVLSVPSRERLTQWLVRSPTGERRIRAGLPAGWRAGDKTGTGANGAVNDVAIIWPPGRQPIVLAIYMSDSVQPVDALEATHAEVTRLVLGQFVD